MKKKHSGGIKKGTRAPGRDTLRIVQNFHPEVTKIVDADEPIEIEVIDEDCKKGRRKLPSSCAMARAFIRKKYDGAIIGISKAYLIQGNVATRYGVPATVAREITNFDRSDEKIDQSFAPGTYHLGRISPTSRLGAFKPSSGPGNGGKRKRRHVHKTTGIRSL